MKLQEIALAAGTITLIWFGVHIYEAPSPIIRANNTCDPVYWLGRTLNKEVSAGFTNESDSFRVEKSMASVGRLCFCGFAKLYQAVSWKLECNQIQYFNLNDQPYKKILNKEEDDAKKNANGTNINIFYN